jgi:glycine hydroxymethyltransferase
MRPIAATIKQVLSKTTAGTGDDGQPSKARFVIDAATADAARKAVAELLQRFPLYPELTV